MNCRFLIIIAIAFTLGCSNVKEYAEHYPSGQTSLEGQYKDGRKIGNWVSYDSLGTKLMVIKYEDDTIKFRQHYIKGILLFEEEMLNENKHGKTTVYYKNGSIESITNYQNGRQTGEQIFYFEDGLLRLKYLQESNGSIINFYQYHTTGKLWVYAKDFQDGIFNLHDSLGNKTYDVLYKDSVPVDTVKIY